MKFGCCIKRVEDVAQAKAAGFDFIEFAGCAVAAMDDREFESLHEELLRTDMPCVGFNAYSSGTPAMIGTGVSDEKTEAYAELLCRRGKMLGIDSLGIGSPGARQMPKGMEKKDADSQFVRFIQLTSDTARKYGLSILIEAVHSGMCNYLNGTDEALAMVRRFSSDNIKMVLDFYHMAKMEEPYSIAISAAPHIMHIHLSTADSGLWRGFPQESDVEEYRQIFSILRQIGYNGTVSIEPSEYCHEQAINCLNFLKSLTADNK